MKGKMSLQEKYTAGIKGIGYYLPSRVVTNDQLAHQLEVDADWIETRFGIQERRISPDQENVSDLAYEAGKQALADAQVKPEEIDLIILARTDPDQVDPATAGLVQDRLGARNAAAFDIAVGPGDVYGLALGANFVVSGSCRNVLVIAAELLSRNLINPVEPLIRCQFGDGAAAAVIGQVNQGEGIQSYLLGADGTGYGKAMVPLGGSQVPITLENVDSADRYLQIDHEAFETFALTVAVDSLEQVTQITEQTVAEMDLVLVTQVGRPLIARMMEKLGLSMEQTWTTVERYGNTAGASVLITLAEAREQGKVRPGDQILLGAMGTGFAWAGMSLKWCARADRV